MARSDLMALEPVVQLGTTAAANNRWADHGCAGHDAIDSVSMPRSPRWSECS